LVRTLGTGLLFAIVATWIPHPATADETDSLRGRLGVSDGLSLADAGAIVVFLEAEAPAAHAAATNRALPTAVVRQSGAEFAPDFLAVAKGQLVEMPNDDIIYHNVFSYSEPNDFDLGMYPSGESRTVRFEYSGLVRIYCSIHERMDGLIFVAPSPLFAIPDSTGSYSISAVPPGRYRLHVWSERLPEIVTFVETGGAESLTVDVVLGSSSEG
jgi:plastocyanin